MKKRCQITLTDQTVRSCFRKLHMQYLATHQAKQKKTKSKSKKLPGVVMDYFEKCSFLSVAKDDFAKEVEETPITNTVNINHIFFICEICVYVCMYI